MTWIPRALLLLVLLLAVFADQIASSEPLLETDSWTIAAPIRANPTDVRTEGRLAVLRPPSGLHLLGTDDRGRDVAARLVHGSRPTLVIAACTALLASLVAILLALVASTKPWLDRLVMAGCDVIAAVPVLLLVVVVRGLLGGGGLLALILFISVPRAAGTARLVREQLRAALAMPYCEAASALGLSQFRVLWRHALPASFSQIKTAAALTASTAVLAEVALSFLGLGLGGDMPSWGELMRQAHENQLAWWLLVPAGLATSGFAWSLSSQFSGNRRA